MEYENNIITVSPEQFPYTAGIGTILYEKMGDAKDMPAQIDGLTGERDMYKDLLQRCIQTALTMLSRHITSNDVIAIQSDNHLNTIVPLLASFFIGATPAFLDFNLTPSDTIELLKQICPKLIFVHSSAAGKIAGAIEKLAMKSEIVVFGKTFADFLAPFEEDFTPVRVTNINEPAAIFFTSGTTGLPKKIHLSHKTLLASTLQITTLEAPSFTTISPTNTFWISFTSSLLNAILSKACRVVVPSFNCCNIWDLIVEYEVTVLMLGPSSIPLLSNEHKPKGSSSLALLIIGGDSFSCNQLVALRKHMPETLVLPAYGQTELGGATIAFKFGNTEDIRLSYSRPTSSGRPLKGYSYKVVNLETEEAVGPSQLGEIRIKSHYCNASDSSEWDSSGFFKTGDVGYYDDDFCFHILDRIKEMFKYQGHLIAPLKLEGVLKSHYLVEDAIVVGLPHVVDGEHPMALVVLKQGNVFKVTESDIQNYVDARVSDVENLRGGVKFVKRLYTNSLGKLKRRQMRDLVLKCQL